MYTAKFETFLIIFKKVGRVLIHQISLIKKIQSKFLKLIKTYK